MCYGCAEGFCTNHFIEHRKELSQHMDYIGREYNALQRGLTTEKNARPVLAYINQWERESTVEIQITAELARTDLQKLLDQTQMNLEESVSKMVNELQSQRDSDDYTEVDINKWMDQLRVFRRMIENPPTVNIDYDNHRRAVIHLIKVNNQQLLDLPC